MVVLKTKSEPIKNKYRELINKNDNLFIVHNLHARSGNFHIKNINFSIPKGKILSILGSSGSGKTILLKSIAGLEKNNAGIIYNGINRFDNLAIADKKIGFVFQNCALFPHLNVKKNIGFPLLIKGDKKDIINEKVNEIFEEFNIEKIYSGFRPEQLSQGIKQLVALGKEKIREFELFLMDEPFNYLDNKVHEVMRLFIKKIIDLIGKTTIIALNDAKDAMLISDYILTINNGEMVQFGRSSDVYENPNSPIVLELLSHLGANRLDVAIKNKKIIPYDIKIDKPDGNYNLYFRTEEISICKKGINVKINKRFFYNSNKELCECETDKGDTAMLLLPIKTKNSFKFMPEKYFLFK